ncbi:MBL fold metallo-hydrolase [Microvirga thermotolerans]|uniref:MBL fold metallo-hydrolase n=1 Tax=Microvirga thermotolerans TaxID=2651334 RepID=A0A5P9JR82_9HYPH|nr:MBL fold metallo-hydrolase [Microvirga thermotolerans]QFU15232.1 MBL fold metallo-hydrolase [Microvirga thermotolerans]
MPTFLCSACGTSYPPAETPPAACPVCDDERQYVPASGQGWTTRERLAASHANAWKLHEPDLYSLQTVPAFAINQRAFLVRTAAGNVLWDCIALLDEATVAIVRALGGLAAIAVSHPHYYTTVQDWSRAFGDVPVYLHAADREWAMRPSEAIRFWEGDSLDILPDATLIRLGGHFPGGTVLHWKGAGDGAGVLLSGDIVQVAADVRRVSFLWSYPNMMPLPAREVLRIGERLAPLRFDRIYGAFSGKDVKADAKAVVERSVRRYVELIS